MSEFLWFEDKERDIEYKEEFDPDIFFDEKGDYDPDKEKEYLSRNDLCLGDLLLNIHAAKLMYDYIRENNYKVPDDQKTHDFQLDFFQKCIAYSKGILVELRKAANTKIPDEKLARQVSEFIQVCRDNWYSDSFTEMTDDRERFDDIYSNAELADCVTKIRSIYDQEGGSEGKPGILYYYFNKMALNVDRVVVGKRDELLKQISDVAAYYPANIEPLKCQMILDDTRFNSFLDYSENTIISSCQVAVSTYLNSISIEDIPINESINNMEDFINSCDKGGNHNFGKYVSKDRCFGLIKMPDRIYISLSGTFDAKEPEIIQYLNFSSPQENRYEDINKKVESFLPRYFSDYIYSEMNSIEYRYPYDGLMDEIKIKSPQLLRDAIAAGIDKGQIGSEYGCCERKMFSKLRFVGSGKLYLFTRKKPCKKCLPAIKKIMGIFKSWEMYAYCYGDDGHGEIKEVDLINMINDLKS